jgi:nitrite reductase/ring-hydroxylating ferredoxin subunit/uncharacterized membrane protein
MTLSTSPKPDPELPAQFVAAVERQKWLDEPAQQVQDGMQRFFEKLPDHGRPVQDALHGTWLGHALHPVMVTIPLGAWTLAAIFDFFEASGKRGYRKGADAAVAIGLASAVGAAASGVVDWQHLTGKTRRVGAAHGLWNVAVAGVYLLSLLLRRSRQRAAGRMLGWLGLAASIGSAYLGGHLVSKQVGVDRTADLKLPRDFVSVLAFDELPEGTLKRADAKGVPVLLFRRGDKVSALVERCAHLGGPLSEGTVEGDAVICPWHQSRFSLEDGRVLNGPSAFPQPCFETRVSNGQIQVRASRTS